MNAPSTRVTQVRFSDEYLNWRRLHTAVEADGGDPAGVILWLSKLLEDDAWRTFRGESWPPFASFEEFVRERDHGLGMEPVDLLLLLSVRGHTEANAHWDGALFDEVREQVAELLGVGSRGARTAAGGGDGGLIGPVTHCAPAGFAAGAQCCLGWRYS